MHVREARRAQPAELVVLGVVAALLGVDQHVDREDRCRPGRGAVRLQDVVVDHQPAAGRERAGRAPSAWPCWSFPTARADTHLHRGIGTAAFVIAGEVGMYFGDRLAEHLVAHSAADDCAGIVLLPALDRLRA